MLDVREMPKGISLKPNARDPKPNRQVYKEVEATLLDKAGVPGTFHYKNKGITIMAASVKSNGSKDEFVVTINEDENHGIVDGGHTYAIITTDREDEDLPENYVPVTVLTAIPDEWVPEISGGLNTGIQVQAFSLDNLAGKFDTMKDLLQHEPYFGKLAWRENEGGDYDARDIVSLLDLFLIDEYPNESADYPIHAYERKLKSLKLFEERPELFESALPILKDVLTLHDTIQTTSSKLWNEKGGRFAALHFVETRKRGEYVQTFTGAKTTSRLMNGALYPILGAFRWKVTTDKDGMYGWAGGFDSVVNLWTETAAELLNATKLEGSQVGNKVDAIGKSRSHWPTVHRIVAFRDLQKRLEEQ